MHTLKKEKNNLLQNIDNYRETLEMSAHEIVSQYTSLIDQYVKDCNENIFINNVNYHRYVVNKGIQTLCHVFTNLLLYTKNINLTLYHCHKALCFYIEFIGQIGDDNHSFLQLNSKDASIFVYKKTIFDINNEYRKDFENNENDLKKMELCGNIINIYNRQIEGIIMNFDFNKEKILNKEINDKLSKIVIKIIQLLILHDNIDDEISNKFKNIHLFSDIIIRKVPLHSTYLYIELFINKLKKKNVSQISIQKKINSDNFISYLEGSTPLKFINWLFSTS
jgi:hypothetical protein